MIKELHYSKKIFLTVVLLSLLISSSFPQTKNLKFDPITPKQRPIQSINGTEKEISSYFNQSFKHFTMEDGLPLNIITSLVLDSIGQLWVGTQDGAAFYNGRIWNVVDLPNRTVSNYIQSMYVSSDSAIWFGTSRGGIYRFHNDQWQHFDTISYIKGNVIRDIQETTDGSSKILWFATNTGILKYEKGKWSSNYSASLFYKLYRSRDNVLWCTTSNGIIRNVKGKWESIKSPKELSGTTVFSVLESQDGEMWFGGNGVIGKYSKNKWLLFSIQKGIIRNDANILYRSSNGEIWIITDAGIMRIKKDENNLEYIEDFYSGDDFLKRMNAVLSIIETPDKSVWFGTLFGLFRYSEGKWQIFKDNAGPGINPVSSLHQSSEGNYFFATYNGLYRFAKSGWTLFDKNVVHSHNNISSIVEDKDGKLWIGTIGDGLNCYDHGVWKHFDKTNGLIDNRIYSLLIGNDGSLWIATAGGLIRYSSGQWETFAVAKSLKNKKNNVLPDNWVTSIGQGLDSSLWVGTRKGLVRFKINESKTYTIEDGLAGNAINYIYNSKEGKMWFGTLSSGVSSYDPDKQVWKSYNDTTSPSLAGNVILQIKEDVKGRLYFLTNNGVTRFTPLLDNRKKAEYNAEVFTTDDGLPSNEGLIRAAMVDLQGNVWIGTTSGVSFLNPLNERLDKNLKPLLIEKININNYYSSLRTLKSNLDLEHNQNDISFEYTLISYFKEKSTRYQHQLVGYDKKKSDWISDYKKEYTNLTEGAYIFRVWGKDYAGNISEPAEFRFVIHPAWWNTWWSDLIKLFLFIGLFFIAVKAYLKFKLRKQSEEYKKSQTIIKERDRIARDVHDAVGGSLTRISMLSERINAEILASVPQINSNNEVFNKVQLIGSTARNVIEEMSEIIWSLNTKNDKLENLIYYMVQFVNKMFEASNINLILESPTQIPHLLLRADYRWNIYLIFKEIVNNVIKHSDAKNAHCGIDFADSVLSFTIYDDGKGFIDTTKSIKGYGLQNIQRRAKTLNAVLNFSSEPGKGTKIEFFINLSENPLI